MGALPGGFGPAVEAGSQNQSHLAQPKKDGQKIKAFEQIAKDARL